MVHRVLEADIKNFKGGPVPGAKEDLTPDSKEDSDPVETFDRAEASTHGFGVVGVRGWDPADPFQTLTPLCRNL